MIGGVSDALIASGIASGKYFVCREGGVWNMDWRGRGIRVPVAVRLNRDGYIVCNWQVAERRTCVMVHRAVLVAHDPRPDSLGLEVNHLDGNKQNNVLSNLVWATKSENQKHAYGAGLRRPVLIASRDHPMRKLAEDDVRGIHAAISAGETQRSVAARLGICQAQVGRIARGKHWAHIYQEFHS